MVPPAPGRVSMTSCWPRSWDMRCATTRATRSVAPLAGKGTTRRTGCEGQDAWPCATAGRAMAPARAQAAATMARRGSKTLGNAFMGTLLDRRSEEHTSELQSHLNLVCRLLLEKKKAHV